MEVLFTHASGSRQSDAGRFNADFDRFVVTRDPSVRVPLGLHHVVTRQHGAVDRDNGRPTRLWFTDRGRNRIETAIARESTTAVLPCEYRWTPPVADGRAARNSRSMAAATAFAVLVAAVVVATTLRTGAGPAALPVAIDGNGSSAKAADVVLPVPSSAAPTPAVPSINVYRHDPARYLDAVVPGYNSTCRVRWAMCAGLEEQPHPRARSGTPSR